MAVEIKHNSTAPLEGGAKIGSTEWNAAHTLTQATARLLGRTTADAGAAEEISVGSGLILSAGSLTANAVTSDSDVTADRLLKTGAGPAQAFRRGNILGTVSQSGGVPTGAVVESGSGANGTYVRFANGLQICWHYITLTYVSTAACDGTWTFPASFSSNPVIDAIIRAAGGATPIVNELTPPRAGSVSNSQTTVTIGRIVGLTNFAIGDTISNVGVRAIGPWF